MDAKDLITRFTGEVLRELFNKTPADKFLGATEIRIRLDKPLVVKTLTGEFYIGTDGLPSSVPGNAYRPVEKDISVAVELLSNYSLYAFQEEIRNGYITVPGGHRVGISGRCAIEDGKVKIIKNISSLCFRITNQIKGCADGVMESVMTPEIMHTMIIAPPGAGKTTLLRDIVRQISDRGRNVGVVDERGEIAGCYLGRAQNDVGLRTDILDGCPKAWGMTMLLRSMSPEVIAVDEIGRREDIYAIDDVINAGIKIICTVHGAEIGDIQKKPVLSEILTKKIFQRFIVLKNDGKPGFVAGVYDEDYRSIR